MYLMAANKPGNLARLSACNRRMRTNRSNSTLQAGYQAPRQGDLYAAFICYFFPETWAVEDSLKRRRTACLQATLGRIPAYLTASHCMRLYLLGHVNCFL